MALPKEGPLSLEKIRTWMTTVGRTDVTAGRSERELAVFAKVCRIAMDLDGVVPHQGARAAKGGEQHDLDFGRRVPTRKTPVIFCGLCFKPAEGPWMRRNDFAEPESVRVYVRLTPEGVRRSPWADRIKDDDGLKPEEGWRYVEIPPSLDISGDALLDLIEDAYFEAGGI